MAPSMRPEFEETFHFACHKALPCFTRCCARLRLVLTPYDILRLKNRLHLSSETFLDRYTEAVFDPSSGLPLIRLTMRADDAQQCPFLGADGCRVYADRPGACRLYPLGRAASARDETSRSGRYYFTVKESHCKGWRAEKEWTIQEWLTDQGLDEYNAMNRSFIGLTTGRPLGVLKALGKRQHQMYYLACYNLDEFRRFVLQSSFRHRFDIEEELLNRIRNDDVALMGFASRWLNFCLFGEKLYRAQETLPAGLVNRIDAGPREAVS